MLNDQDIKKLKLVFATKQDFNDFSTKKDLEKVISNSQDKMLSLLASKQEVKELKQDIEGLREAIQGMMAAVDNLAKVISDLHLEYSAIKHQINRHEEWIKQIAEKVGLKLAIE